MRCEYCGPTCTHCTLQYGCSDCHGAEGRQHSSAKAYLDHVQTVGATGKKTAAWPFRYNSRTAFGGPSSEFRTCVDCKKLDPRCDVCENHSAVTKQPPKPFPETTAPGQHFCDRCPEYVQSAAEQEANGGWCRLQDSPTPNCLQGDPEEPEKCLFCAQDYFVEGGKCEQCSEERSLGAGCLRCSKDGCLQCKSGYALVGGRCEACDLDTANGRLYSVFRDRCTQCQDGDKRKCKHCGTGWQDPLDPFAGSAAEFAETQLLKKDWTRWYSGDARTAARDVCRFKCGTSEHPVVKYEGDQLAAGGKSCRTCSGDQCSKCKGPGSDQCLECVPEHYLEILDSKTRSGRCVPKKPAGDGPLAFDLFVSNLLDEGKVEARQRSGTYADPFAQLDDALVKARELAAPYSPNIAVTIHLFKGPHYIVENRHDALNIYIEKEAIDLHALNLGIHIKPLSCG